MIGWLSRFFRERDGRHEAGGHEMNEGKAEPVVAYAVTAYTGDPDALLPPNGDGSSPPAAPAAATGGSVSR